MTPEFSANDQWQPVITVKPDGTKLFVAWYDRQGDSNNSLIDVYGRWATVAMDGTITFGTQFRISTVQFPPAFTGTTMTDPGEYDPVYPPAPCFAGGLANHMGDYESVSCAGSYFFYTWGDNRDLSSGTLLPRNQANVRLVRVSWTP